MIKKIEILTREIWAKHEKTYGHRIMPEIRSIIENTLLQGIRDSEALDDLDSAIPDYLRLIDAAVNNSPNSGNSSNVHRETELVTSKKRYKKSFEKQLHLVSFVAEKFLTLSNLVHHSFTPHKRINWKLLCNEWNEKHPYDLTTLGVLKVHYYRAIADIDIRREYFLRKENAIHEHLIPLGEMLRELDEGLKRLGGRAGTVSVERGYTITERGITVRGSIGSTVEVEGDEIEEMED
jgi:hypothetical protein